MATEVKVRAVLVTDELKKGIADVNRGFEKLGDSIRNYGREQREQGRYARLFAQELSFIIPASSSATQAMAGLAASLVGGIGIGTAFEIARVAIQYFQAEAEAAAAAAQKLTSANVELAASARRVTDTRIQAEATRGLPDEKARALARVTEIEKELEKASIALANAQGAERDIVGQATASWLQLAQEVQKARQAYEALPGAHQAAFEKILKETDKHNEERRKEREKRAKEWQDDLDRMVVQAMAAKDAIDRYLATPAKAISPQTPAVGAPLAGTDAKLAGIDMQPVWEELDRLNQEMERLRSMSISLGETIGVALAEGFREGGGGAQQFFKTVLAEALRIIQVYAVEAAAAAGAKAGHPILAPAAAAAAFSFIRGLISLLPTRAFGGPVYAGQPYVVGERGPEVVVPGRSGAVVPNHALGGGVTLHLNGAMDGAAYRYLMANRREVARALRDIARDGG